MRPGSRCKTACSPERRAFRAGASGAFDWFDFAESDDEGDRDIYPHNWSPEMETTAAALGLGCFGAHGLKVEIELIYPHTMDALRDGHIRLAADCAHAVPESLPEWRGAKLPMALARGMYWVPVVRSDRSLRCGDVRSLAGTRTGAAPGVDCVLIQ